MSKTLKISYEFEDGKKYIGEYYETEDGYVWHGKGRMTYAGIDKGTIYWEIGKMVIIMARERLFIQTGKNMLVIFSMECLRVEEDLLT